MIDLLRDPVVSIAVGETTGRVSLPQLLALLCGGHNVRYQALQAHHVAPWHAFVVQAATLALVRAGRPLPPAEPPAWVDLLVDAIEADGGTEAAWSLVESDDETAALLQPPIPKGSPKLGQVETTPEGIDTVLAAKAWDVKPARLQDASPEQWLYALVALQTTQGHLGPGNYGIARMNGGYGTRVFSGFAPSHRPVDRFVADVKRAARFPAPRVGFSWCVPWDGRTQIAVKDTGVLTIEICRRVRLAASDGQIVARRGQSERRRIAGDTILPDLWSSRRDGKPIHVPETGLTYDVVADLLFGDRATPPRRGRG